MIQEFLVVFWESGGKLLEQQVVGVKSHGWVPPGTTKRKLPSIEVVASGGQNGTKREHRNRCSRNIGGS
jgi:hypothetical protein